MNTKHENRISGGLWGALVGDALGVPVEFTRREERRTDPVTGMRGFGTHRQPPGTWSDDGSLLLCTVEQLCGEYDPGALAGLFVKWYFGNHWTARGSVFDAGGTTISALGRLRAGAPPLEAGGAGEQDNGNGSLMRILPVALRYAAEPCEQILDLAHRVSALTHRHPRAQMACGIYCLVARRLLMGLAARDAVREGAKEAKRLYVAPPFVSELAHFDRALAPHLAVVDEAEIRSSGYVVHTLEASVWCLLTSSTFEEAILKAVNLGEDTDTTACVTGGLAGVLYGDHAIPGEWIEELARVAEIRELFKAFVRRCLSTPGPSGDV